ncbi:MAG: aldehyde dehydrogenase family protein [Sphingomonadaceae bacterium]|nr:aldehyde dehydrogenase family protein [Sphingomonadaceae bacterium]
MQDFGQILAQRLNSEPFNYINGEAIKGASALLDVWNPATGGVIAQVPDADTGVVGLAVAAAQTAHKDGRWRNLRPADREAILLRFASLIEHNAELLAQLETLEQGKSINLSRMFGPAASVQWLRFAAGLITKPIGDTVSSSLPGGPGAWTAFTRREPIGVVAGIVPWNFPTLIAMWKIAPALAAGCTLVLKPSETTPLTALYLAELASEAGVPPGVFNVVTGRGATCGRALTEHPTVRKISFTGSTAVGRQIGLSAMERMARVTLELGGKNAAIVCKDADFDKVIQGLGAAAFINQGQVCAAASRIYVERDAKRQLVEALEAVIKSMRAGSGMDAEAQINPVASKVHQERVKGFVDQAKSAGASIIEGCSVPEEGYFVPPALVLDPGEDVKLTREEVFGPILTINEVNSVDEAIARTNDSPLGLAASIWTRDIDVAMRSVGSIEAGTIWVNSHVWIDPAMPFGGYKQSGVGRDFGAQWLDGFSELKSICIAH